MKPDGKFYLLDNKSKFGTLVLMRNDVKITEKRLFIQVGNIVAILQLKVKKQKDTVVDIKKPIMSKAPKRVIPPPREEQNTDPFYLDFAFYN